MEQHRNSSNWRGERAGRKSSGQPSQAGPHIPAAGAGTLAGRQMLRQIHQAPWLQTRAQAKHALPLQKQPSQKAAKAIGNYGANQLNKCCFSCLSAVNWTLLAAWQQGSAIAPDMQRAAAL